MTAAAREPAEVLEFWFGPPELTDMEPLAQRWFAKDEAFDREIARRFGPLIEEALAGRLQDWAWQGPTALARILLLDQFTRNAFRGTPRAFAGDALALQAARAMVAGQLDQELQPMKRQFVYLPFEHAEDLAAQDEGIALFTRLAEEAPALADTLAWAHKHRDVIARFGRFPHRNEILGRASSSEESSFLSQPGSRF
jgi:uncharacterized protein (DUF924 family)